MFVATQIATLPYTKKIQNLFGLCNNAELLQAQTWTPRAVVLSLQIRVMQLAHISHACCVSLTVWHRNYFFKF